MPKPAYDSLRGDVPREITFEELFEGEALNAIKLEHFLEQRRVRAVVCGPGAMTSPLTPEVLGVLSEFSEGDGFVVLDAGATHGLEDLLGASPQNPERWLALPHPGEWKRMGASFDASPLNPTGLKKAVARADELGIALLFKNAAPLLIPGSPDMPGFVTGEGDLSLARAGSGDVLAGVAGAHGAVGLGSVIAALRSQVLVAWAAKLAAQERGPHAVTATDVIRCLGRVPAALEALEAGDEEDEDELLDEDEGRDEPEPPRQEPPPGRGGQQHRGHRPWQKRR
jgi:NAD(P)H-hydrate epimerase